MMSSQASREFSFALHQIQQAIEPHANALFVESDCTGPGGKVTQATTSIGEMACLVNIAPVRLASRTLAPFNNTEEPAFLVDGGLCALRNFSAY